MKKTDNFSAYSLLTLSSLLMLVLFTVSPQFAAAQPEASDKNTTAGELLQFRAGNHILGFTPGRIYLASSNHMLSAEFIGANGAKPRSDSNISPNKTGQTQPLRKVTYANIWDGINLTYETARNGITESVYHVAPGSDVSKIRLKYNVPVEAQKDGSLKFKFRKGYMNESAPVAWQIIQGKKTPVEVAFLASGKEVGFRVGKYDPEYALVIDPTYSWHTFYGSADADYASAIALDSVGNIYIAGHSLNTWNGDGGTAPIHAYKGKYDIFVLKLDSSGTYKWHTFYGSADGNDYAAGLMIDDSDRIYICGQSAAEWNGSGGVAPKHGFTGGTDIFVLRLLSNGNYDWHTFYGAGSNDSAAGLALGANGKFYVTGQSEASWDGPSSTVPLHSHSGGNDIFALKLELSGNYVWHTFYGSEAEDYAGGITTSSDGVYLTGYSNSSWIGDAGPLHAHSGGYDIFVLRLDFAGNYVWHTFYGSSSNDYSTGIVFDADYLYIAGYSQNSWKAQGKAPLNAHSSGTNNDIFVLKLRKGGGFEWNTFYGSTSDDISGNITLTSTGNIYVSGYSAATWDGDAPPQRAYRGAYDVFIIELNNSGMYLWHTFYGSTFDDKLASVVTNTSGDVYVTGNSSATWNVDATSPLHAYTGDVDIFVLKLSPSACYIDNRDVLIEGTWDFFGSIGTAYTAASTGQTLLLQAKNFTENVNLSDDIVITLKGGYYDCDYSSMAPNQPATSVTGQVKIGGTGQVIIDNLIIN
jgi:hypothetical protein